MSNAAFGQRPKQLGGRRDLPVRVLTFDDFANVATVRNALLQFEQAGSFTQPAMLAEAMTRDDRIAAALRTRTQGLFGSPRNILPASEDAKAQKVAEELEARWPAMFPDAQLTQVFWWGIHFGVGLGELVWEREDGQFTPTLKNWHPEFVWWNWGPRRYVVNTEDQGAVEVGPDGGDWLLYSPGGYYRGWMSGLVRSLAVPWLIRQWAYRDWARASETLGLGIKKAKVPSAASDDDKESFFTSLQTLGSESLVVLPQTSDGKAGFEFEFEKSVSSEGQAAAFKELIAKTETSIAIAVLGQNLTTEVNGGSRAAAKVHNEIRLDYRRADARSLADAIRDQVLRPWAAYNFGDSDLAPYVEWDVEPEDDRQASAQALATLATAVQTFQQAGAPIDVRAVLEQAAVPMVAEDEALPDTDDPAAMKLRAPAPHVEGQSYADSIAAVAAGRAAEVLRPDVEDVLRAIEQAESLEHLRQELPKLLEAMDRRELGELTREASVLALLAGRRAVRREG